MHGTKFYRPARAYPALLPSEDIVINAPPVLQPAQGGAMMWMQFLFPIVGGAGSLIFILAYHSSVLMIVAGIAMAFCSAGMGAVMGIMQRKMQKKQRELESELYRTYLAQCRTRLRAVVQRQQQVNARLYPAYEQLATDVRRQVHLWERRPTDGDFLSVRIGVGPVPLSCRVGLGLSDDPMVRYVPELRSLAEALVNEYRYLDDMPSYIGLRQPGTLSVLGQRARAQALVRALLCQVVAWQSPEDVRCVVFFPPHMAELWGWLKWLPHVRRLRQVKAEKQYAPDQLCMLASTIDEMRTLIQQQIKPELDRRRRLLDDKQYTEKRSLVDTLRPHLVIVLDCFSPFGPLGQLPEIDELFSDAARLGVTVLCLVEEISQEPTQLQARLSISPVGRLDYEEIHLGGRRLEGIHPDSVDPQLCERIARGLAPLTLAETNAQQDLSQDVRLLDLLRIPSAETLLVADAWRMRPRSDLLRVPLGMRSDGEPLILDLKEAAEKGMGPHGLVVGATGSGKSELLRTLVIGLAATHDPQTINFVLVDFKGGASFADFAALPHVAGIITNLQDDTSMVDRAYDALLGEQQRRQRMLHEAGNLDNVRQYQARWRSNPKMEPMPHLVIIADEFAELIAQRPDFLDLFVTMGRVGRSLGLHLIFATQRLDEGRIRGLEGHLRYRICLRTFSASESSTVLGKSDAYYLPSAPGVGYFKVDTDTYHLFKTALISVPFVPQREQVSPMARIREFTATGALVKRTPPSLSTAPTMLLEPEEPSDLHTEMDVLIERLSIADVTQQTHEVHQVWLPPLRKFLPLHVVLRDCQRPELRGTSWTSSPPFGPLCVPVGLLDLPLLQTQEPLWLDFSGSGGHLALVGAPQSGKSTFLRTLITSLMITHTPREVQFYCVDLGGGLLRVFEHAPHVAVVCSKTERDKVRRVIRQMNKIMEDREFLFREHGIDSMAMFRSRRQADELHDIPFGDVFLVIDNFALFCLEFDLEAEIAALIANGLTYGVHVVLAANRWAEIRTRLRDNIGTRLELRLNDPQDSEFGRVPAAAIPVGVPGRGLNKDKLQFQVALPLVDPAHFDGAELMLSMQQALEQFVKSVSTSWKGETAPPIRLLPALVRWQDIPDASTPDQPAGVPLGVEETRLDPLYVDLLTGSPHFMVLGDSECGKTSVLRTWIHGIEQRYVRDQVAFAIVDYRKTLLEFAESENLLAYAYNAETLLNCVGRLFTNLEERMKEGADVPLRKMRSRRWTGRHYILFVDDYDSLATGSSTPLNPLLDFLMAGRDIGFHVVITRRVSGIGRVPFEPVLLRLREMGSPALIMSGDPQEGRFLYGAGASTQPPGRGILVMPKHPPTLVQIAYNEPAYPQDE